MIDSGHEEEKQRIEEQIAVNAAVFEKANAYMNIMILAGYAGFFTIWSFTNDLLGDLTRISTALLVGVSLIFYVFWEVIKSHYSSSQVVARHSLSLQGLEPDEYILRARILDKKKDFQDRSLVRMWPWFLRITVVPGFLGALLLVYNFVAFLVPVIPNWPD